MSSFKLPWFQTRKCDVFAPPACPSSTDSTPASRLRDSPISSRLADSRLNNRRLTKGSIGSIFDSLPQLKDDDGRNEKPSQTWRIRTALGSVSPRQLFYRLSHHLPDKCADSGAQHYFKQKIDVVARVFHARTFFRTVYCS